MYSYTFILNDQLLLHVTLNMLFTYDAFDYGIPLR